MIIVYTPADGEPEHYDARSLMVSEASIVSRAIDQKWSEIKAGIPDEDLDAMRGIVWVLKKRSNPGLRFGEFDPGVDEMVTRYDKREITEVIEAAFELRSADASTEAIVAMLADTPDAAADPDHARELIERLAADEGKAEPSPDPGPEIEKPKPWPPSGTSTATGPSASGSSLTSSTSTPSPSTG
ncbi:hypothetical protein [Streptomyces jumonjinensis]|uniref:Uncharacterized protein n=1 Tax=Streptomyces jumonjinensis TaxID=1945 RepID=A0A646KLI4_STRJU|nr:hypothetical protein [Streptomyces jumonjinensis]MQT03179.1 hypothetical protein [Streptomyces jumonjinensis]